MRCLVSGSSYVDLETRRNAPAKRDQAADLPFQAPTTFYREINVINELAQQARLPTVYPDRSFVELGGLMSYGPDAVDLFRRAADRIDQILKGARPGEIPFYQPTKFELVINLKTAKTLGLTLPLSLLARADEVIE